MVLTYYEYAPRPNAPAALLDELFEQALLAIPQNFAARIGSIKGANLAILLSWIQKNNVVLLFCSLREN